MSLRSDEWEHSMGFTRRDPNAHLHLSSHESETNRKRDLYLKSLTEAGFEAYQKVRFCIAAVGQYLVAINETLHVSTLELHRHFPQFAKTMGWEGSLYQQEDGMCPAVSISFPEADGSLWFILPYNDYDKLSDETRKVVQTLEARRAALEFCKAWLPSWKWDDVEF